MTDYQDILETMDLLEDLLMQYERLLERNEENRSLIHLIFRYAHNTKGAFSVLGRDDCSSLVHVVENGFDLVRNGKAPMTVALVDISLKALSVLRDATEGQVSEELFDSIKQQVEAAVEAAQELSGGIESVNLSLNIEEAVRALEAADCGLKFYQVEKPVTLPISRENYQALPIYEDIAGFGSWIQSWPRFEDIDQTKTEEILRIVLATSLPAEELAFQIFDPYREIRPELDQARQQVKSVPQPTCASASSRPLRMLIVEDDLISRMMLHKSLSKFGECDSVSDGHEGIVAYLIALEEDAHYDVIFIDIMMPKLDGRTLLKQIRKAEEERRISSSKSTKVVMTTSLKDSANVLGSFREGCEAYLVKPWSSEKVKATLNKLALLPVVP